MMCQVWTPVRMWICIRMQPTKCWKRKHSQWRDRIWNKQLAYNWSSSWKLSFKKNFFQKNITFFLLEMRPFWAPFRMEERMRMPQYNSWKRKAFTVKNHNTKQAIGMQVTLITEIKLQEKHFCLTKETFLVSSS